MIQTWIRPKRVVALAVVAAAVATLSLVSAARAEDTLKLAIGQRGLLDTSISHLGQQAGIFKKHGLHLELLYTQGGGETQQAVISGRSTSASPPAPAA